MVQGHAHHSALLCLGAEVCVGLALFTFLFEQRWAEWYLLKLQGLAVPQDLGLLGRVLASGDKPAGSAVPPAFISLPCSWGLVPIPQPNTTFPVAVDH